MICFNKQLDATMLNATTWSMCTISVICTCAVTPASAVCFAGSTHDTCTAGSSEEEQKGQPLGRSDDGYVSGQAVVNRLKTMNVVSDASGHGCLHCMSLARLHVIVV